MSPVTPVNRDSFQTEVADHTGPVVVDFYANWCPPCRALAPVLDRMASEFDGQIKFVKVNADESPELADSFGVTGLPTLILMDSGHKVGQIVGLRDETQLRDEFNQWLQMRRDANQSVATGQ